MYYDQEECFDIEGDFESDFEDCGQLDQDGYWVCSAAGSEQCDFLCPFREDLGLPVGDGLESES